MHQASNNLCNGTCSLTLSSHLKSSFGLEQLWDTAGFIRNFQLRGTPREKTAFWSSFEWQNSITLLTLKASCTKSTKLSGVLPYLWINLGEILLLLRSLRLFFWIERHDIPPACLVCSSNLLRTAVPHRLVPTVYAGGQGRTTSSPTAPKPWYISGDPLHGCTSPIRPAQEPLYCFYNLPSLFTAWHPEVLQSSDGWRSLSHAVKAASSGSETAKHLRDGGWIISPFCIHGAGSINLCYVSSCESLKSGNS